MTRDDPAHPPDDAGAELLRSIERAAAEATPAELSEALQHLLTLGGEAADRLANTPPPSRRRPRRPDVVTYRVRVDLVGTRPPLWRRLELASDLHLDAVHDALQAAFGWTDSHLHRFASGASHDSRDLEYYLCPFDVDEGDVGVPEHTVRLDEVLVDPGDRLFYDYDYGDDWQHTITLEAVESRDANAPPAVCTAGRRPGPAEDCGGVYGYELIVAASDPTHADHAEAVIEFADMYGDDIDPADVDATPFDLDEINAVLAELDLGAARPPPDLPEPVADLVAAVRTTSGTRRLQRLLGEASLDAPVDIDHDTAARMVRPYAWLLDRVGADGIKLTAAGYLPPVHVAATFEALELADEWIGTGNREDQTLPVLHLRETAQRAGLLRKHKGRLLLTARGRAACEDPVALWWHLAERLPLRSSRQHETQAGLLLLVAVAANAGDDLRDLVAQFLAAIGWVDGDGAPLTSSAVSHAMWDTKTVLRRLGALTDDGWSGPPARPTPDGVTFARAALLTWPRG